MATVGDGWWGALGLGSVRVRPRATLVLEEPTGIAAQPDGSLLVVEFDRRRLLRVVPSTGRVTQVATFAKPWGVARAESGAVFVSSQNTVQRIDPGRKPVAVASVDPALEIGPVAVTSAGVARNTATTFASLGNPRGIDVAPDGSIYVAAADDHRIAHYSASGERLGFVGPRFGDTYALSVAPDGTVYAVVTAG